MSNFNGIVYLTEEQYLQLKENGTLTVGDITINFDESTLYVTDENQQTGSNEEILDLTNRTSAIETQLSSLAVEVANTQQDVIELNAKTIELENKIKDLIPYNMRDNVFKIANTIKSGNSSYMNEINGVGGGYYYNYTGTYSLIGLKNYLKTFTEGTTIPCRVVIETGADNLCIGPSSEITVTYSPYNASELVIEMFMPITIIYDNGSKYEMYMYLEIDERNSTYLVKFEFSSSDVATIKNLYIELL